MALNTASTPAGSVNHDGGSALLEDTERFLRRFVVMDDDGFVALTLWIVHTHAIESFQTTPYIVLSSPEPQCGKTVTLEICELLVREPVRAAGASEAALFRLIQEKTPTLLLDETDAVFGPKARKDTEPLRGLINAGYRRGASILRCVGDGANITAARFATFCPKTLAGIGELPETIIDRSLVIPMRRKRPDETVERLRFARPPQEVNDLKLRLEAFAAEWDAVLAALEPSMPDELDGRGQDVCEPLIAIADVAGDSWPARARIALVRLRNGAAIASNETHGVNLLRDLRAIFEEGGLAAVSTEQLINLLTADSDKPWATWRSNLPIDPRSLARLLKPYGVSSMDVRIASQTKKGYRLEQFTDAWSRYLPNDSQEGDVRDVRDIDDSNAVIQELASPLSPLSPFVEATVSDGHACLICGQTIESGLRCQTCRGGAT